jgi:deoxyribonuclease-4
MASDSEFRVGAHTSTAGGLENAAILAREYGGNCAQIFSGPPRRWTNPMPKPEAVGKLREARQRLDVNPLVIHASYLINLASIDDGNRAKSLAAFRGELDRAAAIGADYLVLHPGSYKNQTVEQGIEQFARNLTEAAKGFRSKGPALLLENTAGAGNALGSKFEELAYMRELTHKTAPFEIGYCIDTCHSYAAGFEITTKKGLNAALILADAVLGLDRIPVIHTNDSQGDLGSHVDRHEHIGEGKIGLAAFERIVNHPGLRAKAFILETPVDEDGDYARNIGALKKLRKKCGAFRIAAAASKRDRARRVQVIH